MNISPMDIECASIEDRNLLIDHGDFINNSWLSLEFIGKNENKTLYVYIDDQFQKEIIDMIKEKMKNYHKFIDEMCKEINY